MAGLRHHSTGGSNRKAGSMRAVRVRLPIARLAAALVTPALLIALLISGAAAPISTVTTDKPSYGAFELVAITGTDFGSQQVLDVVVVRPDGSIVTGNGDDTPGFDTITADVAGGFTYFYQLDGYPAGIYTVNVYDSADTGHSTVLATTTFIDGQVQSLTLKYQSFGSPGFGTPVDVTFLNGAGSKHSKAHLDDGVTPAEGDDVHSLTGIADGDTFLVLTDTGSSGLGSKIRLLLDNGTSQVEIQVHTSCSLPIGVGFLYGDTDEAAEDLSDFAPSGALTAGLEVMALASEACGDSHVPSITVCKDVVPDDSTVWDFTLSGPSPGSKNDLGDSQCHLFGNLTYGSYTLTEAVQANYSASVSCDLSKGSDTDNDITFALDSGEDVMCTVTNTLIVNTATLNVIKEVINNNGGTAAPSDFTMTVTATNPNPASFPGDAAGTTVSLDAGAYSVSESGPSGYAESQSADCSGTIAIGETKTCTVTNNDIQPQLTVCKEVINNNGGTAAPSDFTMTVTATNPSPASFPGDAACTTVSLDAGSYSVSESGPSGYDESQSADCSGTIAIDETKTCTITNNDIATCILVMKTVVNDNGGTAVATDFTMSVTGTNVSPASGPPGTTFCLDPGSYSVSESGPSGYDESQSADCSGTIAAGETKTCTITNNDIQPQLTVCKEVINDNGGSAAPSDFTMTVTATNPNPASFPGDAACTTVSLDAGSYSVSESGPSGYDESQSADCSGTIAIDETKTCTVTNTFVPPPGSITIIKDAIPDHPQDFSFTDNIPSCTVGPLDDDTDGTLSNSVTCSVAPGVYSVSENSPPAGWTLTSATCDDGSPVSAIDVSPSESVTCTFTNTEPRIIVCKETDPDASLQSFTFTPSYDANFILTDGQCNDSGLLNPGTYSVSETVPAGWTLTSATCDDASPVSAIDLSTGEIVTCTFTNTVIGTATLIVIKKVINDDGGTAVAGDFTMAINGVTATGGNSFPGEESPGTDKTVTTGSYTVTESGPSGYNQSQSAGCTGTIAANETKTCTITNNDGPPPIGGIVEINVTNGTPGSSSASEAAAGSPWTRGYLLATIAAAAALIAASGWYARRRFQRQRVHN